MEAPQYCTQLTSYTSYIQHTFCLIGCPQLTPASGGTRSPSFTGEHIVGFNPECISVGNIIAAGQVIGISSLPVIDIWTRNCSTLANFLSITVTIISNSIMEGVWLHLGERNLRLFSKHNTYNAGMWGKGVSWEKGVMWQPCANLE